MSHRLQPRTQVEQPVTVVTGATGGIGGPLARQLAAAGHFLVLPCRNAEKAEALCAAVAEETGNPHVFWTHLDLSSFAAIRAGAAELVGGLPRIDAFVSNAGRFGAGYEETADGVESHLAVNYLAPFLLTHLLLPKLRASPAGRVVNVAGETARFATLRMKDLNRRARFSVLGAYGQSKLALVSFSRLLARRLRGSGVVVYSMQPGTASTDHLTAGPGWLDRLWRTIAGKPSRAARRVARLVVSPHRPETSGRYYFGSFRAPAPFPAYRRKLALSLYRKSAELVGLEPELQLPNPEVIHEALLHAPR